MKNLSVKRWVETKKGNQFEVILPAVRIVCPTCEGKGTTVNPSIDGHGLSSEDMADDDFRESYFRGDYDIKCEECAGNKVVETVDYDSLSLKMKDRLDRAEQRRASDEREAAWERRYLV